MFCFVVEEKNKKYKKHVLFLTLADFYSSKCAVDGGVRRKHLMERVQVGCSTRLESDSWWVSEHVMGGRDWLTKT